MTLIIFVELAVGIVCLVGGADVLVKGAVKLAARFGIPPLIIGLTVVAFGTSAPETAVSVNAALSGNGDIAIGNVLGSNIANILLILGITALVIPLTVSRQVVRLDIPIMIIASIATFILCLDGEISHIDGILLFSALILYVIFLIYSSRKQKESIDDELVTTIEIENTKKPFAWITHLSLIIIGLILLIIGSHFLIDGAVSFAQIMGLSKLVTGLTVVAIGTSLPELATSVIAAYKGERDLAVGNIIGSNLFNLLCVLGLTAIVSPTPILVADQALHFDFPIAIAVSFMCLPIVLTGFRIDRWEGLLLLLYYVAYTFYIILIAMHQPLAQPFFDSMLHYVIPLTLLLLFTMMIINWKKKQRQLN
ncbi:UNVERIFIED_CONTAM: hypothetical protein GTU68_052107 [Idotea baltica]|nr:hypothetical protein [Idotea baltica]